MPWFEDWEKSHSKISFDHIRIAHELLLVKWATDLHRKLFKNIILYQRYISIFIDKNTLANCNVMLQIGTFLPILSGSHKRLLTDSDTSRRYNTWWCHDMEILSTILAICEGNPQVIVMNVDALAPDCSYAKLDMILFQSFVGYKTERSHTI